MKARKASLRSQAIYEAMSERILILDGAMGTMIQRHKLSEDDFRNERLSAHPNSLKGNNDLLSITRPDIIRDIHRQYFEAGADIAETNTFSSTTIAQADYALENWVDELNIAGAKLARVAADEFTAVNPSKPRFVAGSIGPTNRTASISPNVNDPGFRAVSFDDLRLSYRQQAKALIEGGVDLLLVETVFDTINAKAALYALDELFEELDTNYPVMLSGTITDASGRTLSGQTTEAFLISTSHFPLLSIGLNCALGASQLRPYLHILSEKSPFAVSAHPNAGLPNAFGAYDQTAEEMAFEISKFLEAEFLDIVGGCCGTTPEHIAAIAHVASKYQPRMVRAKNRILSTDSANS